MIEFRVQLEVPLDSAKATDVRTALAARNESSLANAKRIVLESIGECATPMFRQIVEQAFDDNIRMLKT